MQIDGWSTQGDDVGIPADMDQLALQQEALDSKYQQLDKSQHRHQKLPENLRARNMKQEKWKNNPRYQSMIRSIWFSTVGEGRGRMSRNQFKLLFRELDKIRPIVRKPKEDIIWKTVSKGFKHLNFESFVDVWSIIVQSSCPEVTLQQALAYSSDAIAILRDTALHVPARSSPTGKAQPANSPFPGKLKPQPSPVSQPTVARDRARRAIAEDRAWRIAKLEAIHSQWPPPMIKLHPDVSNKVRKDSEDMMMNVSRYYSPLDPQPSPFAGISQDARKPTLLQMVRDAKALPCISESLDTVKAREAASQGMNNRLRRLRWRRTQLQSLVVDTQELGSAPSSTAFSAPASPTQRATLHPPPVHVSVEEEDPDAWDEVDLEDVFIPCSVPNCPVEACLWSPSERKAFCVACWPLQPFHQDLGVVVAPQSIHRAGTPLIDLEPAPIARPNTPILSSGPPPQLVLGEHDFGDNTFALHSSTCPKIAAVARGRSGIKYHTLVPALDSGRTMAMELESLSKPLEEHPAVVAIARRQASQQRKRQRLRFARTGTPGFPDAAHHHSVAGRQEEKCTSAIPGTMARPCASPAGMQVKKQTLLQIPTSITLASSDSASKARHEQRAIEIHRNVAVYVLKEADRE